MTPLALEGNLAVDLCKDRVVLADANVVPCKSNENNLFTPLLPEFERPSG